jgi:hypothetical protein
MMHHLNKVRTTRTITTKRRLKALLASFNKQGQAIVNFRQIYDAQGVKNLVVGLLRLQGLRHGKRS